MMVKADEQRGAIEGEQLQEYKQYIMLNDNRFTKFLLNLIFRPINPEALVPQGYLIMDVDRKLSEYYHYRFGENSEKCPICNKQMLRFLEIDTSDPRLELIQLPCNKLPIYYCFSCNLCLGSYFYYKISDSGKILNYWITKEGIIGEPYQDVINENTISASGIQLIKLTYFEQLYILNRSNRLIEKLCRSEFLEDLNLLHPNLIGGYKTKTYSKWKDHNFICPTCRMKMKYLASFNTTTPDGREICGDFDNPEIVSAFCKTCSMVGVKHSNYA